MDLAARIMQARLAMINGEKHRARELAVKIVSDFPLADEPLLLLADLVDKPQEAIDILHRAKIITPDNAEIVSKIQRFQQILDQLILKTPPEPKRIPRLVACPTCKVLVIAKNLQKHIKKVHGGKKVKAPAPKVGLLNNPSNKKRRTRKPRATNPDHEYDALDNAVYFNDEYGVVMIKASRKKSGGRP